MRKGTMLVGQGLAVRRVKRRPGCVTAWANSSSVVSISVVKTTARSRRVKRGPGCVTAWSRVGSTQVYWSPLHHKPQTCNDQQSYTYYTAPMCRQFIYLLTHNTANTKNIAYGIFQKSVKIWDVNIYLFGICLHSIIFLQACNTRKLFVITFSP